MVFGNHLPKTLGVNNIRNSGCIFADPVWGEDIIWELVESNHVLVFKILAEIRLVVGLVVLRLIGIMAARSLIMGSRRMLV
jgi:hypothetical protein